MPKMLITVTEDWAFLSHRVPTAMAALDAGYEVSVVARMRERQKDIEALGFRTIPWNIKRESQNPFSELTALLDLIRIYKEERPDATYHVAIKAIVYGSIASRAAKVKTVYNLFSGMGVIFISKLPKFRLIRRLSIPVLRWLFRPANVRLQVHNKDDQAMLNGLGVSTPDRSDLVPGSGLDTENYPLTGEMDAFTPKAVVVSRMLWDKGIGELAEAFRILKARGVALDLVLIGAPDPANPATITEDQLHAWEDEGLLEWWGRRSDVPDILKHSHIAVLPSYHEGMPRALLEAASVGRPLVAFDAPGCRDLIRDGENGFLVPFRDSTALADALEKLAKDKDLRQRFGKAARQDVENIYCSEAIRKQLSAIFSRFQ